LSELETWLGEKFPRPATESASSATPAEVAEQILAAGDGQLEAGNLADSYRGDGHLEDRTLGDN
jgi:hypothetical protein